MINKDELKNALKLYLVTDSDILKGRDFYKCIEDAIKAGVTMVQLREKNADGKEFLEKAIKLRQITKKYNVTFVINDRVDIAMIADADGVHVGQSDIDAMSIRKLIGEDKIIGVSARNVEEAKIAKENGADYLGIGAMFSTQTKNDAKEVFFETLRQITEEVNLPFVLIGGITLDNVDKLEKKIRALAEQYANQKLMSNGVEITNVKPIDLTFSYKQSNIEKINEQIRYYSEKEKILKKYDIELGDDTTFNIYQDELDATTKKIAELQKQAKLTELNNDIAEYSKSIKDLGYESIKNGVQGLGQMYSNVSGLVDKLNECEDPLESIFAVFDTVFSTIDTIKSFIDGISELVNIINMLTAAKETLNGVNAASTAITTGEAIANEAAGSSAAASATEQAAASGASLEAVAANKALEKSLLDLAAAQIFAAHASIPVVGVGMAQGMVSAMMAAMTAQRAASDALQAFAEGGIVKGSTTMGDNVLVRANAGEMLLNTRQQANLFKLLNSGAVSNNNIEFSISSIKVKGSDLFLALSNHKKITHKTL